jgi:hypothetical protein
MTSLQNGSGLGKTEDQTPPLAPRHLGNGPFFARQRGFIWTSKRGVSTLQATEAPAQIICGGLQARIGDLARIRYGALGSDRALYDVQQRLAGVSVNHRRGLDRFAVAEDTPTRLRRLCTRRDRFQASLELNAWVGGRSKSPQQHHIQRELVACYVNPLPLVAQMRLDCRGDLGKGEGAVSSECVEVCEGVQ